MSSTRSLLDRLLSAALVAAAVALLATGMLGWLGDVAGSGPTALGPRETPGTTGGRSGHPTPDDTASPSGRSPTRTLRPFMPTTDPGATLVPTPGPSATLSSTPDPGSTLPPTPDPTATLVPTPDPTATLVPTPDPTATAGATATPSPTRHPRRAVATRVVIPAMGIDLPIISRDRKIRNQGPDQYPPCDVALYHTAFGQPGEPGTTYLYAHAREGMFLPLLDASKRRNGRAMIGDLVQVYTSDDREHIYRITRVKRHALDFSLATDLPAGGERLILQTSEGPRGTIPKLQIAAEPIEVLDASRKEARPRAKPRACYLTP